MSPSLEHVTDLHLWIICNFNLLLFLEIFVITPKENSGLKKLQEFCSFQGKKLRTMLHSLIYKFSEFSNLILTIIMENITPLQLSNFLRLYYPWVFWRSHHCIQLLGLDFLHLDVPACQGQDKFMPHLFLGKFCPYYTHSNIHKSSKEQTIIFQL